MDENPILDEDTSDALEHVLRLGRSLGKQEPSSTEIAVSKEQEGRIYGCLKQNKASNRRVMEALMLRDSEIIWDEEQSDSIHPLAFGNNRRWHKGMINDNTDLDNTLQHFRYASKDLEADGSGGIHKTKNEEAPEAILLHCWDQAVHKSANTVIVPSPVTGKRKAPDDESSLSKQDQLRQRRSKAKRMCNRRVNATYNREVFARHLCNLLHIRLPQPDPNASTKQQARQFYKCPHCRAPFTSHHQLEVHFFAGNMSCLRHQVHRHELEWAHCVFPHLVRARVDNLVSCLFTDPDGKPKAEDTGTAERVLTWEDVLKRVRVHVMSRVDTMQYEATEEKKKMSLKKSEITPSLQVLRNVEARLKHRYG